MIRWKRGESRWSYLRLSIDWWRSSEGQFEIRRQAESDAMTMRLYPTDFPQLALVQEVEPAVSQLTELPVLRSSAEQSGFSFPPWQTLWPEHACRPLLLYGPLSATLEFDTQRDD